ncbi:hypothetical protein CHARACLAT_022413 [Characodon lateralis]|uniref:Uncharacterized protein n=1 Tax=Characodon lateralis TaxID=208331 RepID=A0ABU7F671_9TELE|nr:hypothetical protein [Characodon lateralis]
MQKILDRDSNRENTQTEDRGVKWSVHLSLSGVPSWLSEVNPHLDAFEVLAENYELNEIEGRCLAFRRAASVLKSLPWAVQCVGATQDLPCLGEHTKAVMKQSSSGCMFRAAVLLEGEPRSNLKSFAALKRFSSRNQTLRASENS